jgi:hypothetical protein
MTAIKSQEASAPSWNNVAGERLPLKKLVT